MNRILKTPMNRQLITISTWLYLLTGIGCGTWLGNPKDPSQENQPPAGNSTVTLNIQGELPTSLQLIANGINVIGRSGSVIGVLTLTQARVALKEIKLNFTNSDVEDRQQFDGPYVVDLLTNKILPDPGTIAVPAGSYKDIKLKLAKLEKNEISGVVSENDPLIERSIYLTGSYRPQGGSPVTVTMDFDLDEEFVLGRAGSTFVGMTIVEGQVNPVIIAFNLERWFDFSNSESDLSDLTGNIVLTKDAEDIEQKIRQSIKENVKLSAKFGKDEDNDGELETSEKNEDD